MGDKLLCIVAQMLKDCLHKCDIIARIGGDEFVALVKNCTEETAQKIYKKMHEKIEQYNNHAEICLSISVGYIINPDENPLPINKLLKSADDNMYKEKLLHRHSSRSAIVNTLMHTLGERDFVTGEHAERMQYLVTFLGKEAELAEHQLAELQILARFHDIGKIGIPDSVLNKPGKLDNYERKLMQQHSEIGYRIAKAASILYEIGDLIRHHHEWWDGSGYPLGLKGYEIPLECRILAIVDAYDAMTSDRPYRKAMSSQAAIKELTDGAWTQFDPVLVKKFVKLKKSGII